MMGPDDASEGAAGEGESVADLDRNSFSLSPSEHITVSGELPLIPSSPKRDHGGDSWSTCLRRNSVWQEMYLDDLSLSNFNKRCSF